ncbi:MAG: serine/threonine-protein phosphatase [Phycisphaeraceae bacterium]|nr:serine/threonine-protein phosphatase [Phycisphaeraceae bacterium]
MSNTVSTPGIDAVVYARPFAGSDHGGDLYYISVCGAGSISRFVVADVAGHGSEVDEVARSLRRLMRKHINTVDQSRFTRRLSDEFSHVSTAGRFATAVLMTYYAATDHLIVCNAGHPAPLWYRADRDEWALLRHDLGEAIESSGSPEVGVANLPLGLIEETPYHQFAVRLSRGDLVVAYTDALMEATGPGQRALGEHGVLGLAREVGVEDAVEFPSRLVERIEAHHGGSLGDDITVLVLHHNAADPPKQTLTDRLRVLGRMMGLGV